MKKITPISYFFIAIFLISILGVSSCASSQQSSRGTHACGSKKQKKAKYKAMKSGRAPGGGMLN